MMREAVLPARVSELDRPKNLPRSGPDPKFVRHGLMHSPRFLTGAGEMATAMRAFNWSTTSIGQPEHWPRPLKTLVGLMLTAKQAMFMAWGPERLMLYNDAYATLLGNKHPCLGDRFEDVWSDIWTDILPLVDQVFAGEPVHMDDITLFVDRDGSPTETHFAFSYTPVYGDDGEVWGLFCPTRDTTAQVMIEREIVAARTSAEEANVAKSTFIANMSHELRTPLSAIIGYSEMLQEEITEGVEPDDLLADVGKIESNARHLLGLINDVLDLSKVESGKMEVFAEDFDVSEMVNDLAGTVQSLLAKKANQLVIELQPGLGTMHSDLTKVRQILLNLLSNAAKFTTQGTITLTVSRDGAASDAALRFVVQDTGIGMTQEQLGRLFQRFIQADASTTRQFGGTGLGLSLSRILAEMLGGGVSVTSVEGQGSTFSVCLPSTYRAAADDILEGTTHPEPADSTSDRDLVLVIDDDADQRALMTRFLQREGFASRIAVDGATGLELARILKPRAILCDVMMPGIDGWSVLSALKADPELASIPVVMVTFVEQRALAASLGAADYVLKPVQWDRFKSVMDRYRPSGDDVLVVEDDEDTRHRIRDMLARDDWTVTEAENGLEGLKQLDIRRPNVILLDLTMPVMDGFTFFERMRERTDTADIPVVVLTALDLTREDRRRLQGASQILNKGDVSLRTLGDRLHNAARTFRPDPD